jgi:hypothetical protein
MRRLLAIAVVALLVSIAGCGGSSSGSDATAKQFVTAVTHDDRGTWCDQIGAALLAATRSGGLWPEMLSQCKSDDLFAALGGCDREAVISGSSVTGDDVKGGRATVTLSSGAKLGLTRSQGQWYITAISGGSPQHINQGRCAGAGGA